MQKKRLPRDPNSRAAQIVALSTGQPLPKLTDSKETSNPVEPPPEKAKNPAAVELGRLGGLKGGKARAAKLTTDRLREIATQAAKKRWSKKKSVN